MPDRFQPESSPAHDDVARVLLLSESTATQDCLRSAVADQSDITVDSCSDLKNAISQAREIRHTVILLGLRCSVSETLTLIREFQTDPLTGAIPILGLAGPELLHAKTELLAAGVCDFLSELPERAELLFHLRYHSKTCLARRHSTARSSEKPAESDGAEKTSPSGAAPLNLEPLLSFSNGDGRKFSKYVTLYLEQSAECLDRLDRAIHEGCAEDVQALAHKLKGSSALYGITSLMDCLRELEQCGETNQLKDAPRWYAQATENTGRVAEFLNHHPLFTKF